MSMVIDKERGEQVAELLYNSFSTVGIHGRKDMPEDITRLKSAAGATTFAKIAPR